MRYKFKKLELHNFLSFGDATIDLQGKGYCLISGKNNNPSDRALSNGSGKSTIISGISYCLTGQTIQGVKSNIENIFTTGGCYVSLEFSVDANDFIITRYKNHDKFKTDLKIFKNSEDISGKGIRESENILAQELPELTPQLLSSVILLGQGLPSSFTKNTPSGRKELLEQLTGSDFMIEDVKVRINGRLDELNDNKRSLEDTLLKLNTKKNIYEDKLNSFKGDLNAFSMKDYDLLINELNQEISTNNSTLEDYDDRLVEIEDNMVTLNNRLSELNNNLARNLKSVYDELSPKDNELKKRFTEIDSDLKLNEKELNNIKNIKEFCPTCKQRIVGVVKPDTSAIEKKIEELSKERINIMAQISENMSLINTNIKKYQSEYNDNSSEINKELGELRQEKDNINNDYSNITRQLKDKETQLNEYIKQKENQETYLANLYKEIEQYTEDLETIENDILYNNNELDNLQQHIDIVTKMSTLVKRDFRGYLLLNIIEYVERKSKEYCDYIFNSNDLEIKLNGNNIDILFSGKDFESLSGGEKQKIDVIIQFAIRDMMSKYLDFKANILFLDEITDNLDSVGCDGLINLISNTLNDLESIFIISHHKDEIQLPCDTEIVVVKNSNGISEIE